MNFNNKLNTTYFENDMCFKTLEHMLETLDHITPKKLSRQNFNNLKGDILKATGEDKFGVTYDLHFPEDLVFGELLSYIELLNKKFDIKNHEKYKEILTSVKIFIGTTLRNLGNEKGEQYLKELKQQYNISTEFVDELNGASLLNTSTKEQIRDILSKRTDNSVPRKLGISQDVEASSNQVGEKLSEEFKLEFLRKGINLLQYGLQTITQSEQQAIINYCEQNGFEKEILDDGRNGYIKGEETIAINIDIKHLDVEEELLREKVKVEEYKQKLNSARDKTNNEEEICKLEIEAANHLLKTIYEFPYILSNNNYGYQPSKIARYKEMQCVGYNLVGHTFLNELGIKHNGLNYTDHSALEIIIGGEPFLFDATSLQKIEKVEYGGKIGEYKELIIEKYGYKVLVQSGDPEQILLSQILNNKGISLGKYEESIKHYNEAIKLNPNDATAYNNKGFSLHYLGRKKLSNLNNYIYEVLSGKKPFKILYRKEKSQIDKFIENKDFEGLRLYMLELEKE